MSASRNHRGDDRADDGEREKKKRERRTERLIVKKCSNFI
jgi:hypothetical protein